MWKDIWEQIFKSNLGTSFLCIFFLIWENKPKKLRRKSYENNISKYSYQLLLNQRMCSLAEEILKRHATGTEGHNCKNKICEKFNMSKFSVWIRHLHQNITIPPQADNLQSRVLRIRILMGLIPIIYLSLHKIYVWWSFHFGNRKVLSVLDCFERQNISSI